MPAPFLKTKLFIPAVRPELVSRRRLIERLDEGLRLGRWLTLVSAPAGFGKTTLVSEWIRSLKVCDGLAPQAAWISLDKDDNDPVRFWTYVLTALCRIPCLGQAGVGVSTLSMLQSPQPPSIETLLIDLINDIAEMTALTTVRQPPGAGTGARNLVLVLDDLHVVDNPQVYDALGFLIDNLPPLLHLVIATRSDPPLPLSRLRGRGQLTEVTAAELRFTPQEATAFLNRVMGLGLSTEDVAALEKRTEGWVVGLQMAALALQGAHSAQRRDDLHVSEFIAELGQSHRYVLDYLTDEVLLQEPEDVQSWLLQTSILDRLCGSLCDAVTGRADGQEMLERLDVANLFIIPLDGERQWYRYHGLFADLLRRRLARHVEAARAIGTYDLATLHRRASEWYEHADLIEQAIAHALAGEDMERAAALIERHAVYQMIHHRREVALAGWLDALPQEWVRSRPWLCVYLAWTRYWMGQREQVEACLRAAEENLAAAQSRQPAVRSAQVGGQDVQPEVGERSVSENGRLLAGYISAIRAHHALTNQDIPRVIQMAQRAIEYLPDGDYMRCEAAVALGGAYWSQGDVLASQSAFAQARATAQKSGHSAMAVPSSCYLAEQQTKRGQLHEACATYREAMQGATGARGRLLPVAGFPLIKLGDLAREWNDLESAGRDLPRGIELCRQLGQADVLTEGYVMMARLDLALGDTEGAQDALKEADRVARGTQIDPWIVTWADEVRLRIWLSTGNLAAACHWLQQSGLTPDGPLSYQHDLNHIHVARVLIARGREQGQSSDLDGALVLLDRLVAAADKAGWIHEQIKALILRSLALEARGKDGEALAALQQALSLGEPGGYVRTFIDEGVPMASLLHQAAAQGIRADYAGRLLGAFEFQVAEKEATPVNVHSEVRLVEPLSDREIEVLELIAQGLSNREVGQRLYISQGTVKAHTSNIYGKLGVRSRTQAVACAQSLGLLDVSQQ
jgi:LuxR family maltose regulon positive regulatory protein